LRLNFKSVTVKFAFDCLKHQHAAGSWGYRFHQLNMQAFVQKKEAIFAHKLSSKNEDAEIGSRPRCLHLCLDHVSWIGYCLGDKRW